VTSSGVDNNAALLKEILLGYNFFMKEKLLLGAIQGITEWLPISSEGVLFLAKTRLLQSSDSPSLMMREILFLHLGTFFACLFYFRRQIFSLEKKVFRFLFVSTFISGFLGLILFKIIEGVENQLSFTGKMITLTIGVLLVVTAGLQIKAKAEGFKKDQDLTAGDGILFGLVQGLAVLPGLSRSGLTISFLLLRKFEKTIALKLSFLASLPIVLLGNIFLNFKYFSLAGQSVWSSVVSFFFGVLTIDFLMKLAKKVNFGYFVLFFGLLNIVSFFC